MAHVQTENEEMSTEDFLQAQIDLYGLCFGYVKSVALRAAVDLQIPDAIHRRGGSTTLSDVAAQTGIHGTKVSHLRRLMRLLAMSGVFSVEGRDGDDDAVYKLTQVSRLLVAGALSPIVPVFVDPLAATALFSLGEWFTDERASALTPFEVAHGCTRSEMTAKKGTGDLFDAGMVADSRIVMEILLNEHMSIFQGVGSLVDVGGGHGAAAAAVAKALPHVKCTVLDLQHVVARAPTRANVQFVAGDVFQYIPPADAVLLKWVMGLWQDEDAVKVLRRCKEAIPAGGKVIIFEAVVGSDSEDAPRRETQLLFDIFMMRVDGSGERDEQQWRKIIFEAGFSDYKISAVLGFRSIIEVYP